MYAIRVKLSDYTYELPEDRIAVRPPKVRGSTKLLVLNRTTGQIVDSAYARLDEFLKSGDLLVINNTFVLPARLLAKTAEGNDRELLLLEQHGNRSHHKTAKVMYRGKIRANQTLYVEDVPVRVMEVFDDGTALVEADVDMWQLAEQYGEVPLPPYMRRAADAADKERYQTVFASQKGSVAAPTASLNLTPELLDRIRSKGVSTAEVTLHVGLGTFMPIRTDDITQHKMHEEYFEIPNATIQAIRQTKQRGGRVIAVGTTVTRTLEFAADRLDTNKTVTGEANIFIYPGYSFKVVDAMLTNFHAPESTVLMMAAAFAGWDNLKAAYKHALESDYQFLSYGDSMFIQ